MEIRSDDEHFIESVEEYLQFRANRLDIDIEPIGSYDSMHWLDRASFLDRKKYFGEENDVFLRAYEGDHVAIDRICLLVIEHIVKERDLKTAGSSAVQRQKEVMGDAERSTILILALASTFQNRTHLRPSLVWALRTHLEALTGGVEKSVQAEIGRDRAAYATAILLKEGTASPTMQQIADMMGVDKTTISRWRKIRNFREKADDLVENLSLGDLKRDFNLLTHVAEKAKKTRR